MISSIFTLFWDILPWSMFYISFMILGFAAGVWLRQRFWPDRVPISSDSTLSYRYPRRIAILIASKDGAATIERTIKSAKRNRRNIFVVSDGSTDDTARLARRAGAKVLALRKNVGKPTALHRAYRHFELAKRYDAVAILDDDVIIESDFINNAQKQLKSDTAISVGRNITYWPDSQKWNIWLAARAYSYWNYQTMLRRIQSEYNVMNCISGSNSLYRTEVLDQVLQKQTPYIVDDTFWTLETHRLKLGKIVYAQGAKAHIQDPTNFRDWYKQNIRWMWGTFQGVIGHRIGLQLDRFHASYVLLMIQWLLYVLSAPLFIWVLFQVESTLLPYVAILLFVGYSLWVLAAALSLQKSRLLLFIPSIIFVDFLFRIIMVHSLIKAIRQPTVESCVWKSPKRITAEA